MPLFAEVVTKSYINKSVKPNKTLIFLAIFLNFPVKCISDDNLLKLYKIEYMSLEAAWAKHEVRYRKGLTCVLTCS